MEIDHLTVLGIVTEAVVRRRCRQVKSETLRERIRWGGSQGSLGVPSLLIVRRCSIRGSTSCCHPEGWTQLNPSSRLGS